MLQVMHFRSAHDCDPVDWVEKEFGPEIRKVYATGTGSYAIADEYEWLTSDMVNNVVETRTHTESVTGENNPMKRREIAAQFHGDANPARRADVRKKISDSVSGFSHTEEAKQKIARKNSGNEISEEHRKIVSEASSNRDTSYMQSEEYRKALSESLKGREPTYPTPYEVDSLSHLVRSSWEEEMAKLLVRNDISYRYEEEFELSVGSYYPDFVTDPFAIEVKGFSNQRSIEKATAFMKEYPSYTYIVVGDEIPCHYHVPWDRRTEVLEVITDE